MWPQKWYASASPGATIPATVPAPVSPMTAPDTRERKPRRDVPAASRSESRDRAAPGRFGGGRRSGTERPPAAFGGREDRLELRAGVERALGEDGPVGVERDGERAARRVGSRPRVRVADLLECPHRDPRVAREGRDGGRERPADPAAL